MMRKKTGIVDSEGTMIRKGDWIGVFWVSPMGQTTQDMEYQAEVIFKHGCYGVHKYPHQFVPLIDLCEREQGRYISNFGNETIIHDRAKARITRSDRWDYKVRAGRSYRKKGKKVQATFLGEWCDVSAEMWDFEHSNTTEESHENEI